MFVDERLGDVRQARRRQRLQGHAVRVRAHGLQHYLVRIDAPTVICDFIREEEERAVDPAPGSGSLPLLSELLVRPSRGEGIPTQTHLAIMARMIASRQAIGGATGDEIEINSLPSKDD